jgi:uncharacterized protein YecT (DUF1311 family)
MNRSLSFRVGVVPALAILVLSLTAEWSFATHAQAGAAGRTSASTQSAQSTCNPVLSRVAYDECLVGQLHSLQTQLRKELRVEGNRFGQNKVAAVQAKWQSFAESECHLEASLNQGGTAYGDDLDYCLISLTSARLTTLSGAVSGFPH